MRLLSAQSTHGDGFHLGFYFQKKIILTPDSLERIGLLLIINFMPSELVIYYQFRDFPLLSKTLKNENGILKEISGS